MTDTPAPIVLADPNVTDGTHIGITRIEQVDDAPALTMRSVPAPAWDALIKVAMWVSRGRSAAFTPDPDIAPAYPDAAARRALGALHDAGLLEDQGAATKATEPGEGDACYAEPPNMKTWGDCWCTLPPGHNGEHRCQPCTDRHGAPGWTDAQMTGSA